MCNVLTAVALTAGVNSSKSQGCLCQDPCTEDEYQPDCGNQETCKGEAGICTIGSQKGWEFKQGCAKDNDVVGSCSLNFSFKLTECIV